MAVLWGEKNPQFIIPAVTLLQAQERRSLFPLTNVIDIPLPARYEYHFVPEMIIHNIYPTYSRKTALCKFVLFCTLYYNKIDKEEALKFRRLINYSLKFDTLLFKPHKDYSRSYRVKINEQEGWNFNLVQDKQANGYEGTLVCRGIDSFDDMPEEAVFTGSTFPHSLVD